VETTDGEIRRDVELGRCTSQVKFPMEKIGCQPVILCQRREAQVWASWGSGVASDPIHVAPGGISGLEPLSLIPCGSPRHLEDLD
jgi:hypothetical protein